MAVELVQDDMELTPGCEAALNEIFERYDKDEDGALNYEELQAFATFTNGEPFSENDLEDIRTNLECTNDGKLLREGFMQMYSLQTNAGDEDETWKDLKMHGYNAELKLSKKTDPETSVEAPAESKEQQTQPSD
ncbi:hypothetical protein GGI26_002082 [Coemansia sp. RSA 1358]|nr:hypothetical protein BX070DRAFT_228044 [Coemansia spiralis]KAJ1989529.1 hypothetical protein EDC05_004647 [Coemansia umbellata]KAJ2623844.1 hypothetical protein GGI26_002082 [Coemansia sp. RSA 1358]